MAMEGGKALGNYLLGVDNGLTEIKATLFDLEGKALSESRSATEIYQKEPFVEKDMIQLWKKTAAIIRETIEKSGVSPEKILGVCNSAHGNGLYLLDRNGAPLGNAILSMDGRAKEIPEQWRKNGHLGKIEDKTKQHIWAGQPAALLRWIKEYEPERYQRIGAVLFCKDWLKYCLTGEVSGDYTDVSAGGLLDLANNTYSPELMEQYGIPEMYARLPRLFQSAEICGYVSKAASQLTGLKAGTPVAGGAFDVNACCIGMGCISEGQCGIIGGTWTIDCMLSSDIRHSPSVLQNTRFADSKQYLLINSSPTSTINLEWFLDRFCGKKRDYSEYNRMIANYSSIKTAPVFLPYLYSSLLHPGLKASFLSLNADHDFPDLLYSVYEGIVMEHCWNLRHLMPENPKIQSIRLTGGASRSEAWCQLFADVLQRPIECTNVSQSGTLGAAILAGISVGVYHELESTVDRLVQVERMYHPNPQKADLYESRFRYFSDNLNVIYQ